MNISALSQSAVEEKIKWRQDENDNDGEKSPVAAAVAVLATAKSNSPTSVAALLSRNAGRHQSANSNQNQAQHQHAGKNASVAGKKAKGLVANYYVVLEKSPPRMCTEDSDTSTYDKSYHSRETEFCQDSTDYDSSSGDGDSFSTEGMTTIDFLEYEVASASDNDADSVNNSSSGTEDHGLVLTATALRTPLVDSTSSTSDFADSEESDSDKLFDKELSEADYWECIQCRNPNNNPLYPMCEKCYKIRRTHFPPRPKTRKRKLNRLRTSSALSLARARAIQQQTFGSENVSVVANQQAKSEGSMRLCDDISGKGVFKSNAKMGCANRFKNRKLNYRSNKSQLNSAAETSDEDDAFSDNERINAANVRKRKSPLNRYRRETVSTNVFNSGQSSLGTSDSLETASLSRKRSSSLVHGNESDVIHAKQLRISNEAADNTEAISDTDNESVALLTNNTQKDSGLSSAPSSQEPGSSSLSDEKTIEKDELMLRNGEVVTDRGPATILSQEVNLGSETIFAGINHSNLIRSVSDISATLNSNLSTKAALAMNMNSEDSIFSKYGSCTMCFSGPKNGVFVHSNNVHLCSCYKCAVRIWSRDKKCPVCNLSAKNVLKLFVH